MACDIAGHLNTMNQQLEGTCQTALALFDAWKAFLPNVSFFSHDIQT